MTASTPTERKRPGDELIITEPKKVPRLGTSPETTTIHNPQMLASDPATKQSDARITPPVQPVVTNPGSSLLIEKDQLIEHLQLELARANDELAKTQNKLLDTEYKPWNRSPSLQMLQMSTRLVSRRSK